MEKYNKTHEDMHEFQFDWSETAAILKNYLEDESDLGLRQYAAIQLGQLPTHPGVIDSNTILKIMEILPPNSKLWGAAPYLPSILVHQLGMEKQTKLLKEFAEGNPDRVVRAISLAELAMRAHFGSDNKTAALYYEKLKTEYGDIKEIQFQLMSLNPDKVIAAGKPVPDFEVKLMDNNKTISNKSLLGTFYLIDFWAVWCAPCVQEMENLHAVFDKFNNKNFSILSLSFDPKPEDVQKFREKKWAMPWPNAFVEKGFESEIAKNFDVFGIPKAIFVGPDGVILEEGPTLRGENLEKSLSNYLDGTN
jgi:peroxiredoxin